MPSSNRRYTSSSCIRARTFWKNVFAVDDSTWPSENLTSCSLLSSIGLLLAILIGIPFKVSLPSPCCHLIQPEWLQYFFINAIHVWIISLCISLASKCSISFNSLEWTPSLFLNFCHPFSKCCVGKSLVLDLCWHKLLHVVLWCFHAKFQKGVGSLHSSSEFGLWQWQHQQSLAVVHGCIKSPCWHFPKTLLEPFPDWIYAISCIVTTTLPILEWKVSILRVVWHLICYLLKWCNHADNMIMYLCPNWNLTRWLIPNSVCSPSLKLTILVWTLFVTTEV